MRSLCFLYSENIQGWSVEKAYPQIQSTPSHWQAQSQKVLSQPLV